MIELQLGTSPVHCTKIRQLVDPLLRRGIKEVLRHNSDLFVWSTSDIPIIDPDFVCHKLSTLSQAKPIPKRKKVRG